MTLLPPSDYPWPEPPRSGVLTQTELLPQAELNEGALLPDLGDRTPVAAVGSNASLTVLRNKLGHLLENGLPVAVARVEQLAVGHSAHVSARGYIAAAPYVAGEPHLGDRSHPGNAPHRVTLGWFDQAQLAAMDATEPNYRRVSLPSHMPCHLPGGNLTTGVEIYASVHGVLGEAGARGCSARRPRSARPRQVDVDQRPLQLLGQAEVLAWLAHRLPPAVADALDHGTLVDAARREQVRVALLAADLVVPSGL